MSQGFPESIAAPGVEESWTMLAEKDPDRVQAAAKVDFDPARSRYRLMCLGQEIGVDMQDKIISSPSSLGRVLLKRFPEYTKLSILRYLVHARNSGETGQLIKPSELPGGDFFTSGTHVLPLGRLARSFDHRPQEFTARAGALAGQGAEHGDVSVTLYPFPRIPIHLILWFGDQEFAAWASLLLDSSSREQMPVDIVWSTAMMTLEMFQAPEVGDGGQPG